MTYSIGECRARSDCTYVQANLALHAPQKNKSLVAKDTIRGLTHSHIMTLFTPLGNKPLENTVGKGEIARNEQFLLFPQCFLPVWITFCHLRQI